MPNFRETLARRPQGAILCLALLAALHGPVYAESAPATDANTLDRIQVIGSAARAREITGAAQYIGIDALQDFSHTDIQRVLRQAPGVYVIEEDGYGLRPNIGIRGSGIDRSSRITLMEDGVLIAPAAYAAPAAYYFPTAARMSAVEILKGAAAVRNGPRTTGGAINLISTPIPEAPLGGHASVLFGRDDTVLGHAWLGGRQDNGFGFLVETVQQHSDGFKRLDGGGDTGYDLQDSLVKLAWTSDSRDGPAQRVELRLGRSDQDSDETYLGLAEADFRATPYRRYAASRLDDIEVEHTDAQLRHAIAFNDRVDLSTVVYRHETTRAWYKLQDVAGTGLGAVLADPDAFAAEFAWLTGGDSPADALRIRNNNRAYEARGVQTALGWRIDGAHASHQLQASVRYHEDEEDRFQQDDRYRMQDGRMLLTTPGLPGSQDNRVGSAEAWSWYLSDEISVGRLTLAPGLRYEDIRLQRVDYARTPEGRGQAPTRVTRSEIDQWIPGFGASWDLGAGWTLFGSVTRGFNPPGPGSDAEPERSRNHELGVRLDRGGLSGEAVAFYNDYANLVGTCTESTGGGCDIGAQFDGGRARMAGMEARLAWTANRDGAVRFPLRASYTWTDAEFRNSFGSDFEEWGEVAAGDALPYLPEQLLWLGVGAEGERWSADLSATWIDEMRETAGQGNIPAGERIGGATIVDLAASWRIAGELELLGKVENLLGETYLAARRPYGARPGRPRSAFVGVRYRF
ncbi:TonB-dependent receptor [Luteimonas sp. SJ-92]|uniref:TonB-dependent receptor n=1 Tax=Luteimonas salinisoli TaxID=2752307 RepID=A0A853JFR4_9GAMM|nr:TonB-dependent receptor [Luteimonas salinisoli]NZA28176.1 TonB-dependent receptor [Luteimonas salinisoli]